MVTGGPGSGKTDCIERLKAEPVVAGFLFFEELARQLLEKNPDYRQNRTAFHREIYRLQTRREAVARNRSFITDRGTADAFAFHPETLADVGTTLETEYARYHSVIQLGSAAALGEEFYRRDAVRLESIEDALTIERAITNVWKDHPGYRFIEAIPNFDKKYAGFLNIVEQILVLNKN